MRSVARDRRRLSINRARLRLWLFGGGAEPGAAGGEFQLVRGCRGSWSRGGWTELGGLDRGKGAGWTGGGWTEPGGAGWTWGGAGRSQGGWMEPRGLDGAGGAGERRWGGGESQGSWTELGGVGQSWRGSVTAMGTGWSQGGWTALAACLCLRTSGCRKGISGTVSSSLCPRAPHSWRALPWVQGVESLPVNPGRSCSLGAALWWPALVMASVSVGGWWCLVNTLKREMGDRDGDE